MAHVTVEDVNAWLEPSKLSVSSIEASLEQQVANMIFGRLGPNFTVSGWTDDTTTPLLIRTIIAMHYASWIIDRAFSDSSSDVNEYAVLLRSMADTNIEGLLSGVLEYEDIPTTSGGDSSQPVFFPNDASSSLAPTVDTPHDGPAVFTMGQIF
jgi:hypothetical protein